MEEKPNYVEQEFDSLYTFVERYAAETGFANLKFAVSLVHGIVNGDLGNLCGNGTPEGVVFASFHHSLSVTRMLIDLRLPFDRHTTDLVLTAALCHVMPENFTMDSIRTVMERNCTGDVLDMVQKLWLEDNCSDGERERYFAALREDEYALLVAVTDQSHLAELLYAYSSWEARNFIHDTRQYYIPLCTYAKEHYPEIMRQAGVIMEKMRSHTTGAEILLQHYEQRETELTKEILALQEENAAFRQRIRALREADAAESQ